MDSKALLPSVGFTLESEPPYRALERVGDDVCYVTSQIRRIRKKLLQVVEKLPARERELITAHYFDGRLFEEIAVEMQVSKGRITQLHKKALHTLLGNFEPGRYADWCV